MFCFEISLLQYFSKQRRDAPSIYINAFSLLTCCCAEVVKGPLVECCGSSVRLNALGVRKIRKNWCWFMQPRMGRVGGWGLTTDTESWLKCSASGCVLEICVYLWPFYLILLAKRHQISIGSFSILSLAARLAVQGGGQIEGQPCAIPRQGIFSA